MEYDTNILLPLFLFAYKIVPDTVHTKFVRIENEVIQSLDFAPNFWDSSPFCSPEFSVTIPGIVTVCTVVAHRTSSKCQYYLNVENTGIQSMSNTRYAYNKYREQHK